MAKQSRFHFAGLPISARDDRFLSAAHQSPTLSSVPFDPGPVGLLVVLMHPLVNLEG